MHLKLGFPRLPGAYFHTGHSVSPCVDLRRKNDLNQIYLKCKFQLFAKNPKNILAFNCIVIFDNTSENKILNTTLVLQGPGTVLDFGSQATL